MWWNSKVSTKDEEIVLDYPLEAGYVYPLAMEISHYLTYDLEHGKVVKYPGHIAYVKYVTDKFVSYHLFNHDTEYQGEKICPRSDFKRLFSIKDGEDCLLEMEEDFENAIERKKELESKEK